MNVEGRCISTLLCGNLALFLAYHGMHKKETSAFKPKLGDSEIICEHGVAVGQL